MPNRFTSPSEKTRIPANFFFSKVYCQGPLLQAAQFAYIYNDSKSFVDMPMAYDEGTSFLIHIRLYRQ